MTACVVYALIYLIIGVVLLAALAGYLFWRLNAAEQACARAEAECRNMKKDRAIRRNLQHILNARDAEIKRLREELRQHEADAQALENRTSELNLTLFHESGLRILAEKEESAKRMKMALMERQLEASQEMLRQCRQEAKEREAGLNEIIDQQRERIERLTSARGRRARWNPADSGLDQVTLDDLLGGAPGGQPPPSGDA